MNSDFLWGAASAAYQVEGAWNEDGKGPSVWDSFSKIPGKTFKGSNGDIAVDHYHRFREDVNLMAEMGLKAYRFSISWPRVLPRGKGEVNPAGLNFYDQLVDTLLAQGIEPIITIYHWDVPEAIANEYGAWESRKIIADFDHYAQILFRHFGTRVKNWISLNEQNFSFVNGYVKGSHPPGLKNLKLFYEVNHIALLANAQVIKSFRELIPDGKIGPSFAYSPAYPASAAPADMLAFDFAEELTNHWWLDAYVKGHYPETALAYLQEKKLAPKILQGDLELLAQGKPDFIGLNYYQTLTYEANDEEDGVSQQAHYNTTGEKNTTRPTGIPGLYRTKTNPYLPQTQWDWNIDPVGLRIGLRRVFSRYGLPIMITENGRGDFDSLSTNEEINDDERINYLDAHIEECKKAMKDGVPLLGYFVWSFTDVQSWLNGYQKRYGLVYINRDETNPKDLRRIKKKSYNWYKNKIKTSNI